MSNRLIEQKVIKNKAKFKNLIQIVIFMDLKFTSIIFI